MYRKYVFICSLTVKMLKSTACSCSAFLFVTWHFISSLLSPLLPPQGFSLSSSTPSLSFQKEWMTCTWTRPNMLCSLLSTSFLRVRIYKLHTLLIVKMLWELILPFLVLWEKWTGCICRLSIFPLRRLSLHFTKIDLLFFLHKQTGEINVCVCVCVYICFQIGQMCKIMIWWSGCNSPMWMHCALISWLRDQM